MTVPVRVGLDRFLGGEGRPWRRARLGLIVHGASVTSRLVPAVDALRAAGYRVTALFAPEHGLDASLQDQAAVEGARDPRTGLTVHSLYGSCLAPTPGMLRDLDALVFDLQDVGVRYYTFVWTLALALRACARPGKPFIVLDRPNPLGGVKTDGNRPDPAYRSFVGLHPVPVLHGLTAGELALWLNKEEGWDADLHVVRMAGWRRKMVFEETGLPWVLPSPNMPTADTARVYGGACLLEATNLSEGRGTTRPFEITGAPFIDGHRLAEALNAGKLPGVRFRPLSFRPTFNKWAGEPCGGVQWHVTDFAAFRPFLTGLMLLQTVRRLWPRRFRWNRPPYEYETEKPPMDILCGTDRLRKAVDRGEDLRELSRPWAREQAAFRAALRPHLLYR